QKGENQFGSLQVITFHQPTTVDKEPEKTPCKMQSVFVCILLSSNELTFRELASFTSFLKTWLETLLFE
ncbi:hypothetical protein, partial [Streptococcus sp. IMAU 99161]|uniref:hypothetical protein n=1 Tax=Streptococcus sp. IMAU 99161 TaxID=2710601 RepID=UPI001CA3BDA9